MEFTFDVTKIPVIGKRWLQQSDDEKVQDSPRRSPSLSPADNNAISGWKRPWMSQVRHQIFFYSEYKLKYKNLCLKIGDKKF